jgi:hypothetical protein
MSEAISIPNGVVVTVEAHNRWIAAERQLAAERALTDALADALIHAVEAEGGERYVGIEILQLLARYREARGL